MLKLAYRYDQTAARLMVEGLPDISADHGQGVIGILSSWKLQFVDLQNWRGGANTSKPCSPRFFLTPVTCCRVSRPCGGPESPVSLSLLHPLVVTSCSCAAASQPGVEPLSIQLDDAELADLVRCLDAMRLDPRVQIAWVAQNDRPLARRELAERIPLMKRIAAPVLGGSALVAAALLVSLLPLPSLKPTKPAAEPTPTSSPAADSESGTKSDINADAPGDQ